MNRQIISLVILAFSNAFPGEAATGKVVFPAVNQDVPPQSKQPTLQSGSQGDQVEGLQRTLNARLQPSPRLSVDGDFGPATKAAVIRWQKIMKLPADGVVNEDDWKALGRLVAAKKLVPDPKIINQEKLKTESPDSLTGPPFVTAKAWAIADLKTGEVLYHMAKDKRLDIASTTKIMTALLVLELAENDSGVLEEVITFSSRADKTRGSTSGVKAGETLPVRELLYGLLLPSGNDASVALAEHFGSRFGKSDQEASYDAFVEAMNKKARTLGMTDTRFRNPHGLTAKDHQSTAADLTKLASAAMKLESFRRYVSTRQHGCTVKTKTGEQRNVVWRNTNQLLPIENYLGIKTGTTTAAGACLVSACRRDGRELSLVVLGCGSSRGRYVDSRNLYRWAWNQLKRK